jgi:hypothetical protein
VEFMQPEFRPFDIDGTCLTKDLKSACLLRPSEF